ncbi:hypothetical protein POM88_051717 [Heracleum sosnowskyi]|uniref:Uncharacterized protein n=1 Tax=Heracleum sosnowskyi TaxID=360622 RepID=A0AAD8H111_9APIA|nr:hypothetical protein POM88_051717 [Heracleum sosnowskyi]
MWDKFTFHNNISKCPQGDNSGCVALDFKNPYLDFLILQVLREAKPSWFACPLTPQSILEDLRHLPVNSIDQSQIVVKDLKHVVVGGSVPELEHKNKGTKSQETVLGTLHVDRTKDWILKTSAHVDKLLSATFPNLCVHPAQKVRKALLAAIEGLLSRCYYTLKESRLVFLECLFVLVCDDFEEVSEAAQVFLGDQFSSRGKHDIKHDVAQIFSRLMKKLPNVVLGSEEALAISHAQKLLALIYFSGPRLVKDHLLQSPVTAAQFLDSFALCLGQNSAFAGSLQNLMLARPSSTGYLHSIAEIIHPHSPGLYASHLLEVFSLFIARPNEEEVSLYGSVKILDYRGWCTVFSFSKNEPYFLSRGCNLLPLQGPDRALQPLMFFLMEIDLRDIDGSWAC